MAQPVRIYIASSWRNQHAVEMLTSQLRELGYIVLSFVENNFGEGHGPDKFIPFETWVKTEEAVKAFNYDMRGACTSDITIYIGPSGKDAVAEAAMSFAKGKILYALWAKGEDFGLMRLMFNNIFFRHTELLEFIHKNHPTE